MLSNLPIGTDSTIPQEITSLDSLLYPNLSDRFPIPGQSRSSALAGPAVAPQAGPAVHLMPPVSITGAENTFPCSGQYVTLDYCECTLSLDAVRRVESCANMVELLHLGRRLVAIALGLPESSFEAVERPRYGYRYSLIGPVDGCEIWYGHSEREDIHIRLKGSPLRVCGTRSALSLVRALFRRGASFSWLDGVMDDYDQLVSISEVNHAARYAVSHTKTLDYQRPVDRLTGEPKAEILYFGSKSSRQLGKLYDKGLESGGVQLCLRWELRLREESAQSFAAQITATGDDGYADVIRGRWRQLIDFREPTSIHTERRPLLSWWKALVCSAQKLPAYPPVAMKTFQAKYDQFVRQYGPFLAVMMQKVGGDLAAVQWAIKDGAQRIRPRWKPYLLAGFESLLKPGGQGDAHYSMA